MATRWARNSNEQEFFLIEDHDGNAMAEVVYTVTNRGDWYPPHQRWVVEDRLGYMSMRSFKRAIEARDEAEAAYESECEQAYQARIEGQNS